MATRSSLGVVVIMVGALMLGACADTGSVQEGDDVSVDLGAGESRQEQISEIEVIVGLLGQHMGEDPVLRDDSANEWTPEYHEENRRPTADCSDDNSYRNRVIFDYPGLDFQEAYAAAERISGEIGFTANDDLNDDGSAGSRMIFGARGEGGRSLVVREKSGDSGLIEVVYNTRCSTHESHDEAMEKFREQAREERRREREGS